MAGKGQSPPKPKGGMPMKMPKGKKGPMLMIVIGSKSPPKAK
jgi:hypothetical protein